MTVDPPPQTLARWILGGIVAGGIVVGIAIAAYAVGYHRGEHHHRGAAAATTTAAPAATTAPATSTTSGAGTTVAVTPQLTARGKQLYAADACSGCHSLTGAAGAGPSFKGLAGSSVALDSSKTVTADDAYLERSITEPDADIVKGYHAGIMGPAIVGFGLRGKLDDVRALVAFIKSQK
jgi:mono/diheme cytochrome c family protein